MQRPLLAPPHPALRANFSRKGRRVDRTEDKMNPITAHRRHYEDLAVGEVIDLGMTKVTKDMITGFASEFDPFPFHLDEEAAKASLLGGLASSGWQTAALTLRMLVDTFLSKIAAMGGLGFSDLKWKKPVMVGDTIGGTATIAALRRSNSHPDRGILTLELDIRNQKGEPVMSMQLANLVEVRKPESGPDVTQNQADDAMPSSSGDRS
jgi:acyl dehydratase